MYVELQVDNKRSNIKRLVIRERAIIGRQSHCDIRVVSTEISREHCQIEILAEGAMLTDLGSTNGTFLNKKRVEAHVPTLLRDEDQILAGPAGFTVHLVETMGGLQASAPAEETISPLNKGEMETLIQEAPEKLRGISAPSQAQQSPSEEPAADSDPDDFKAEDIAFVEEDLKDLISEEAESGSGIDQDSSFLAGVTSDNDIQALSEDDAFEKYLKNL